MCTSTSSRAGPSLLSQTIGIAPSTASSSSASPATHLVNVPDDEPWRNSRINSPVFLPRCDTRSVAAWQCRSCQRREALASRVCAQGHAAITSVGASTSRKRTPATIQRLTRSTRAALLYTRSSVSAMSQWSLQSLAHSHRRRQAHLATPCSYRTDPHQAHLAACLPHQCWATRSPRHRNSPAMAIITLHCVI